VRFVSQARDRCQEYVPKSRCLGRQSFKRYCIDRFEYPNHEGEKATVGVNYFEANDACASQGKRLCKSSEWELACEGSGLLPYPYGYVRDSSVCNFDKPYIIPNNDAYANLKTRQAEIDRLDQREPSGARAECVSTFGVRDMTGNVDEWVENESGFVDKVPYRSALKGGYWGPVRNRCRPMTLDHNQWHTGYQIGFRCCSDVPTLRAASAP
jgi:formylglycine-generating enzyme required for sulfatase activity